jgi:hypothetical protein
MAETRRRSEHTPTILGCLLVLAGVYAPALEVEVYGRVSYMEIGGLPPVLLLGAALVALISILLRLSIGLKVSALTLWVALAWPFARSRLDELVDDSEGTLQDLGQAVTDGLNEVATDAVLQISSVSYGVFVLLGGCLLVTWGAFRRRRRA